MHAEIQLAAGLRAAQAGDGDGVQAALRSLAGFRNQTPQFLSLLRQAGGLDPLGPISKLDRSHEFYHPPVSCQIPDIGAIYEVIFGTKADGTFVEVGAYDGETYSNTSFLADLGWRGVYIEPVPDYATICRARHARNPSVSVVETAIGSAEGRLSLQVAGPLTTAHGDHLDGYRAQSWAAGLGAVPSVEVPVRVLADVLTEQGVPPVFDLLVVDVEGAEADVLSGIDLAVWQPTAIILELADRDPALSHIDSVRRNCDRVRALLEPFYTAAWEDKTNTIFLRL